jgi:hypothetical protein
MMSKIRIKMGAVEVECEGSEQFLTKELPEILGAVSKLYSESGVGAAEEKQQAAGNPGQPPDGVNGTVIGTTATIAGKLNCSSGADLIIAAAAHLTFVSKMVEFPRKDLLAQTKGASGYYNENIAKNFTNYVNARVKAGELLESKPGHYTLNAAKKAELGTKLAS